MSCREQTTGAGSPCGAGPPWSKVTLEQGHPGAVWNGVTMEQGLSEPGSREEQSPALWKSLSQQRAQLPALLAPSGSCCWVPADGRRSQPDPRAWLSVPHSSPRPLRAAGAVTHGAGMSKSLRQSHGAGSAAVGSPASLPRLSRSPGTSWWPQAPVPALGKAGAGAARALPCRHSTCSGNVGSSSSPGDDGPGFGGIKPRSLRVLAQPWLLQRDRGNLRSGNGPG